MTATTNGKPQPQRLILAVRPPAVGGKNAPEENSADLTKSL